MIDWTQGGWSGSLRRYVAREVKTHLRRNVATRGARYGLSLRFLQSVMSGRFFSWFVACYLIIDLVAAGLEIIFGIYNPSFVANANILNATNVAMNDVFGFFITAQVGVLTIISLAVGLITLIAERSSKELRVYYHETLTFEFFASSVALLTVLCVQVFWPLQNILHQFGWGAKSTLFEIVLNGVHAGWLIVNLSVLAHFLADSLSFVQPEARIRILKRYTANVSLPHDLTQTLLRALYRNAGPSLFQSRNPDGPHIFLGTDLGSHTHSEIETNFRKPSLLFDVRMVPLGWVLRRWLARCRKAESPGHSIGGLRAEEPILVFRPSFDVAFEGPSSWCLRRGGVPLSRFEKAVIWWSFRFRRVDQ